ncbi:cytochrome-c peroxidase [Rhizobium leguminosarum]|uniref:cytochrome-c peroxidase n=1 Tax=Rhizobium leguminosarum TaxID=384 RepID=UPI0028F3E793|nr:cytochrome c peroxidase [Rhizobium leguminosarum]
MTRRDAIRGIACTPATIRYIALCVLCFLLTLAMQAIAQEVLGLEGREPLAPLEDGPALEPKAVELGRQLFSDPILSANQDFSCMTCHDLSTGGTVHVPRPLGPHGEEYRFNAPTVFNVGSIYRLGWRGDFTSLERQNEKVLLDEGLMAVSWPALMSRLQQNRAYATSFEEAYGRAPDRANILDALSAFQRSLTTPNSAFDRYLEGDTTALSTMQLEGYRLFKDYGCASCHQGANVGGNMFQRFGIFASPPVGEPPNDGDLGRYTLTGKESDKGVFRVPSLRNVEVTAPYFHDGRAATLAQAVGIMGVSQLGRKLTPEEIANLVEFLKSLTGEYHGSKLKAPTSTSLN